MKRKKLKMIPTTINFTAKDGRKISLKAKKVVEVSKNLDVIPTYILQRVLHVLEHEGFFQVEIRRNIKNLQIDLIVELGIPYIIDPEKAHSYSHHVVMLSVPDEDIKKFDVLDKITKDLAIGLIKKVLYKDSK